MAFPGGPLPSSIPDRRIDSLPPETSPVGGTSYRGTVEEGVYLFVVCYFGRRMELSFPETILNSLHTCGASSSLCMVAFRLLRASALFGPVSVPPHGWPEPTPAPRRCPRSHLQQDTGTVPRGAETQRGRSQLQHPAGRDSTPSPMRQTPLPNRPINKCGTGAFHSSREGGSCLFPLVFSLSAPSL